MDYLTLAITISGTAGGFIVGLLCGFGGIKKLNETLNRKQWELDGWKQGHKHVFAKVDDLQGEVDRLADLVAKYQAKQPERTPDGKFTSKRDRVTAELAAYVASKAA